MPTYEHENVNDNANNKEGEEETHIQQAPKAVLKMKKPTLKSKDKQPAKQKDAQLSTGDALAEEKTSSSGQDVQMALQQQPLEYEKGDNEKRMYQKAFITRMSIRSFSSIVAQLNEAQTEAVRSMGFASFLEVYLNLHPYSASFTLPDGKWFTVTAFDAYVTLGVPIGGREIMKSSKSSTDEEYDEMHATRVKEWKIEHAVAELTHLSEFVLAKKRRRQELQEELHHIRGELLFQWDEEPLL
ncbi:hypothetical protein Cgig2_014290 [Carnegiea gigantea]|uniref:Uncharacterized protein n=1 Tax=Carnegiea gigantea TaxID=171969 RepID=A0A9Q1JII7_9CARY|nr:hypothetical protein Cgig2_014290 [Carnegiea gigantea]